MLEYGPVDENKDTEECNDKTEATDRFKEIDSLMDVNLNDQPTDDLQELRSNEDECLKWTTDDVLTDEEDTDDDNKDEEVKEQLNSINEVMPRKEIFKMLRNNLDIDDIDFDQ